MAVAGVCEDDPSIRRAIGETMRRSDHRVVMAHNGTEAVRLFAPDTSIDVVILDIGLPDSDGRDVCQAPSRRGPVRAGAVPHRPRRAA